MFDDFDLIVSSFQSQYGLRLARELDDMSWKEFRSMLAGISPDTALGRIVAIRSETDKDVLKYFNKEQHRIRNEWMKRKAKEVTPEQMEQVLESFKQAFISLAGGVKN